MTRPSKWSVKPCQDPSCRMRSGFPSFQHEPLLTSYFPWPQNRPNARQKRSLVNGKCGMVSFLNHVSKFDELEDCDTPSSVLLRRTDFFGVASTDMRTASNVLSTSYRLCIAHSASFVTN
ncbi:hypothetical protein RRG08_006764 [Elysia crispata]|uniref:Uncharacterized protein n=1 Tax=Elysia crispata TaxID=231223 RepID=A0AAE0Y2M4_9GAST|nr:hypothetical protein RRG08_006764 [Elysia crispata]